MSSGCANDGSIAVLDDHVTLPYYPEIVARQCDKHGHNGRPFVRITSDEQFWGLCRWRRQWYNALYHIQRERFQVLIVDDDVELVIAGSR